MSYDTVLIEDKEETNNLYIILYTMICINCNQSDELQKYSVVEI